MQEWDTAELEAWRLGGHQAMNEEEEGESSSSSSSSSDSEEQEEDFDPMEAFDEVDSDPSSESSVESDSDTDTGPDGMGDESDEPLTPEIPELGNNASNAFGSSANSIQNELTRLCERGRALRAQRQQVLDPQDGVDLLDNMAGVPQQRLSDIDAEIRRIDAEISSLLESTNESFRGQRSNLSGASDPIVSDPISMYLQAMEEENSRLRDRDRERDEELRRLQEEHRVLEERLAEELRSAYADADRTIIPSELGEDDARSRRVQQGEATAEMRNTAEQARRLHAERTQAMRALHVLHRAGMRTNRGVRVLHRAGMRTNRLTKIHRLQCAAVRCPRRSEVLSNRGSPSSRINGSRRHRQRKFQQQRQSTRGKKLAGSDG